jgi:L-threonylcarbamoyladenylate synthase
VNDADVQRAAALLLGGGVVAFPTETVYGLGAVAFDPRAVARIFEIKERPFFDPLIVHVLDNAMLGSVAQAPSSAASLLMERFWPGPLTLVLRRREEVPSIVTSGLETIAVRMPSHPVARALLAATGAPLAAPSANAFGRLSPTRAEHVYAMLGDRVDLIVDGGATPLGIESTIVQCAATVTLLRAGAIPVEALEAAVGPVQYAEPNAPVVAPGGLERHYAPMTPLRLIEPSLVPAADRASAAVLSFEQRFDGYAAQRVLAPDGDLRAAAARFFEALHELDALDVARIDAQPLPDRDLGIAMNDRLRRAAH